MRLAALLLVLGSCGLAAESASDFAPGDDDGRGDAQCAQDQDCILAGASCCECPSFAVRAVGAGHGSGVDPTASTTASTPRKLLSGFSSPEVA